RDRASALQCQLGAILLEGEKILPSFPFGQYLRRRPLLLPLQAVKPIRHNPTRNKAGNNILTFYDASI
ncbi:MAG: hypothetical protein N3F09_03040, partial [Bacteroidia bacterium]|nr:hypothetical protein [Bacteroidia bacterium]